MHAHVLQMPCITIEFNGITKDTVIIDNYHLDFKRNWHLCISFHILLYHLQEAKNRNFKLIIFITLADETCRFHLAVENEINSLITERHCLKTCKLVQNVQLNQLRLSATIM